MVVAIRLALFFVFPKEEVRAVNANLSRHFASSTIKNCSNCVEAKTNL